MSGAALSTFDDAFDPGEADYFSAILAQQNAAKSSEALPEALANLGRLVISALESEGIKISPPKAAIMNEIGRAHV